MKAAIAGSAAAREELFRRNYPRVVRLAHRLLGREDAAEDLAQDVFVAALSRLSEVDHPEAFDAWLNRICVYRARSRIRHYKVLRRLRLMPRQPVDPDQVLGGAAAADVSLELKALYGHLQALRADVRIALVLRRVEGRSIDEIADMMGCSRATVKRRVAEGHSQLRIWMGEDP